MSLTKAHVALGTFALAAIVTSACKSSGDWTEDADREVYEILTAKRAAIATGELAFTIEPPVNTLRHAVLRGEHGVDADTPLALNLVACIEIGAENSRAYANEREDLYLTALDLTLDRWTFGTQHGAGGSANLSGSESEASLFGVGVFGSLTRLLGSGAQLVFNTGVDLARVLTTGDPWAAVSNASFTITQPLLRGFGKAIVQEPLTQAERDVVYGARSYERFRRRFAVDVANRYFRILSQRDTLGNEQRNYERLEELRVRSADQAEAGRRSGIEVDQARQDTLRASDRVIQARQSYAAALDDFKLFLGLPIVTELELLDESGLVLRADDEILNLRESVAVAIAEAERLDFMTTRERMVDSERSVVIRRDGLRTGLAISASVGATSEDDKLLTAQPGDPDWSLGLDLNLPVDLIPERNRYRSALIQRERSRRSLEEATDRIRLDLRDLRRELDSAAASYKIQKGSVELAERRVEGADLSLQAGRSSTRDLLEAREDLLEAQNQRVRLSTDLTLAGLDYLLAIERLRIDERGIRVERNGPELDAQEGTAVEGSLRSETELEADVEVQIDAHTEHTPAASGTEEDQ